VTLLNSRSININRMRLEDNKVSSTNVLLKAIFKISVVLCVRYIRECDE